MEEVKYRINLDVHKGGVQTSLSGFRVGDAKSRTVRIYLMEGGHPYHAPTGCTVTLYAKKPDGTVSYSMCTVKGSAIEHTFTSGELAVAGEVQCEVRILSGGEEPVVLSSPQFEVIVEDVLQDDSAIESTNEYSALTKALAGLEEKTGEADRAAAGATAAAGQATTAADRAEQAAVFANTAAQEVREQLKDKTTSYVLQWSSDMYDDKRGINEPILKKLCEQTDGMYQVVLMDGDKELHLSERETTNDGYVYHFPDGMCSEYIAFEYIVIYKPATKQEAAEYSLEKRNILNGQNLDESDFRPPTTSLLTVALDMHEQDRSLHVTDAERTKWNAAAGNGTSYTLSKSGATITLTGSDGTASTVTDADTKYGMASTTTPGLMSAADKIKLDGTAAASSLNDHISDASVHITAAERTKWNASAGGGGNCYVLQWSNDPYEDKREINEPVLETLCDTADGMYQVVLIDGDKEVQMSRREYTSEGYVYHFPGEMCIDYVAYEYMVMYKPATKTDAAVYQLQKGNVLNGQDLDENDFRPPTTSLLTVVMDMHEQDKSLHVTDAERTKWNDAAENSTTYTLSKSGTTITLTGSDGSTSKVTESSYADATTSVRGLMSAADKTKLNGIAAGANNYVHPSHTAKASGLYKVTVDSAGHISAAAAVSKADITPLLDMEAIIAAFPDASEVSY